MNIADPYNHPFPKRTDLMSLSKITVADTGHFKKNQERASSSLKTDDISGAQSAMRGYNFSNKEHFTNRCDDIEKSSPKKNIRDLNKPFYSLINDDINGTKPMLNKFFTSRATNPLEPEYKLPHTEIRQTTPPKYIRDAMNINDIEGSKMKPNLLFKVRNVKDEFKEIEGSRPKPLFVPKDQIDILNVKDINEYRIFRTTRITNPLNPHYVLAGENGEKFELGEIKGNKSRQLHPVEVKRDVNVLATKDIPGAWAGTRSNGFLRREERKDYRQPLNTLDIFGTQVGTLKKGMISQRHTNPLIPEYQLLGAKEMAEEDKILAHQNLLSNLKNKFNLQENQKIEEPKNEANLVTPKNLSENQELRKRKSSETNNRIPFEKPSSAKLIRDDLELTNPKDFNNEIKKLEFTEEKLKSNPESAKSKPDSAKSKGDQNKEKSTTNKLPSENNRPFSSNLEALSGSRKVQTNNGSLKKTGIDIISGRPMTTAQKLDNFIKF